jgi:hypothetical protein
MQSFLRVIAVIIITTVTVVLLPYHDLVIIFIVSKSVLKRADTSVDAWQ